MVISRTNTSTVGEVNVFVGQDLKQKFQNHKGSNQYGEGINDDNDNINDNDNNKNINTNQVFTIENYGEKYHLNDDGDGNKHGYKSGSDSSIDSSSEKEMNQLRNEIAVNEMVNDDVFFQQQTRQMKINSIVNDDNLDKYAIEITKDGIEKQKKKNVNMNDVKHDQDDHDVNKNNNFSSMLKDKVVGVNMIENDIIDDIQQELNDPHGEQRQTKQTPKENVN